MAPKNGTSVGLFAGDPNSWRVERLEAAFSKLNVDVQRIIPWRVHRRGSKENHSILLNGHDISRLDRVYVLELGGHDIGSFFSRVGLLSALAEKGVDIVNSVSSILVMRNKAETMRKLIGAGLPVPETLITESIEVAADFIRNHWPCVLKPITGFGGLGVQLISTDFDLENIYDYLKFHSQMFGKGAFLLQEFIEGPGFDIRALVIDGKVEASMQRVATKGIVTNVHSGGKPRPNDIDVDDLAVRAANSVKGRIVGVDVIPDKNGELWLLEVNATPGWFGIQEVTEFDIAIRIAEALYSG
ncbi:MAG: RimK family alpha-L-glutamate ligase [Candidatus Thorarchaeota archaeon]|nr:MAG: RimK family alpha-L-glutamate ligase [Candidatus Thorarchaeota archaeon]